MDTHDHILVVEDDDEIRELLVAYLEKNGCRADGVTDGAAMWTRLDTPPAPDLLVLDIMLPGDDGLTLCRTLRADPRWRGLPIIMLTARGDETDRIVGLEMGADDYLPKPFNPRELLARINSVLRRSRSTPIADDPAPAPPTRHRFDGWLLDEPARRLHAPDGSETPLTPGEMDLLILLVRHAGTAVDRDTLTRALSGRDAGPFDRGVDVQIGRLRKRLGDDSRQPRLIHTVRGVGYRLDVPVVQET